MGSEEKLAKCICMAKISRRKQKWNDGLISWYLGDPHAVYQLAEPLKRTVEKFVRHGMSGNESLDNGSSGRKRLLYPKKERDIQARPLSQTSSWILITSEQDRRRWVSIQTN
jgi:hypothetical protein